MNTYRKEGGKEGNKKGRKEGKKKRRNEEITGKEQRRVRKLKGGKKGYNKLIVN